MSEQRDHAVEALLWIARSEIAIWEDGLTDARKRDDQRAIDRIQTALLALDNLWDRIVALAESKFDGVLADDSTVSQRARREILASLARIGAP